MIIFFKNLVSIFQQYKKSGTSVAIFVMLRYLTCPWNKILDHITQRDTILDIGCGHGLLFFLTRNKYGKVEGIGIDHDAKKIEIANHCSVDGTMFYVDPKEIDKTKDKFTKITIIDILYSIPPEDWGQIFTIIERELQPGGKIIIKETVNTPYWKYQFCKFQEFVAIKVLKYTKGDNPILPSIQYYLDFFTENGFIVSEHKRTDSFYLWPHYLFVLEKK